MQIIAIYETDAWHQKSKRNLIALATSEKKRDTLVRKFLREYQEIKIPRDDINQAIEEIRHWGQTQSLNQNYDFEIDTETFGTNEIVY